jgi:hypothetical protein
LVCAGSFRLFRIKMPLHRRTVLPLPKDFMISSTVDKKAKRQKF